MSDRVAANPSSVFEEVERTRDIDANVQNSVDGHQDKTNSDEPLLYCKQRLLCAVKLWTRRKYCTRNIENSWIWTLDI